MLLVAGLAALPLPLAPLQLLWLNLVTDTFPALALASEPGDAQVIVPPRNPQEAILPPRFLHSVLGFGLVMAPGLNLASLWALAIRPGPSLHNRAFITCGAARQVAVSATPEQRSFLRLNRIVSNPYALLGVTCCLWPCRPHHVSSIRLPTSSGWFRWTCEVGSVPSWCARPVPAMGGQVVKLFSGFRESLWQQLHSRCNHTSHRMVMLKGASSEESE